jgi:uncharacterized protein
MVAPADRDAALDLVVTAIGHRLRTGRTWLPSVDDLPAGLRGNGAAFVTLREHGRLRGCIGTLTAYQPLGIDIARHAQDAAFGDPRFPPLAAHELPRLDVSVSVLSADVPLPVTSREELRRVIRPGRDGLIVVCGPYRGTFLPAVWESLPGPDDFLDALWRKAGLVPGSWPAGIVVSRYEAEEFGGPARDRLPDNR